MRRNDISGNTGTLAAGNVQWMTTGSGIMHQEIPNGNTAGQMHGFQLWANLPTSLEMTAPRYQDVEATEIVDDTEHVCGSLQVYFGGAKALLMGWLLTHFILILVFQRDAMKPLKPTHIITPLPTFFMEQVNLLTLRFQRGYCLRKK